MRGCGGRRVTIGGGVVFAPKARNFGDFEPKSYVFGRSGPVTRGGGGVLRRRRDVTGSQVPGYVGGGSWEAEIVTGREAPGYDRGRVGPKIRKFKLRSL